MSSLSGYRLLEGNAPEQQSASLHHLSECLAVFVSCPSGRNLQLFVEQQAICDLKSVVRPSVCDFLRTVLTQPPAPSVSGNIPCYEPPMTPQGQLNGIVTAMWRKCLRGRKGVRRAMQPLNHRLVVTIQDEACPYIHMQCVSSLPPKVLFLPTDHPTRAPGRSIIRYGDTSATEQQKVTHNGVRAHTSFCTWLNVTARHLLIC